jgi:hypothetical protein
MIAWIWQATTLHWNTELAARNHVPLELWVVLYEKSTTNHICCTHQVLEVAALRSTFKAGIRDAAHQAMAALLHKEDDQM